MITPTQAQTAPVVGWEAEPGAFYTLVLTDPDAPSRASPTLREWVHWVRVNIPGDNLPCDGEDGGDDLKTYVGAGPPASTGLHRYVFLLYKQPNGKQTFEEDDRTPFVKNGREKWSAAKFAEVGFPHCPVAFSSMRPSVPCCSPPPCAPARPCLHFVAQAHPLSKGCGLNRNMSWGRRSPGHTSRPSLTTSCSSLIRSSPAKRATKAEATACLHSLCIMMNTCMTRMTAAQCSPSSLKSCAVSMNRHVYSSLVSSGTRLGFYHEVPDQGLSHFRDLPASPKLSKQRPQQPLGSHASAANTSMICSPFLCASLPPILRNRSPHAPPDWDSCGEWILTRFSSLDRECSSPRPTEVRRDWAPL